MAHLHSCVFVFVSFFFFGIIYRHLCKTLITRQGEKGRKEKEGTGGTRRKEGNSPSHPCPPLARNMRCELLHMEIFPICLFFCLRNSIRVYPLAIHSAGGVGTGGVANFDIQLMAFNWALGTCSSVCGCCWNSISQMKCLPLSAQPWPGIEED